MKAIVITAPGSPDVLKILTRAEPVPAANEVLIKVAAAGVNRPDIFQRKGNYPPPADTSQDIPGLEISGTVIKIGADCTRWKPGDEICALVSGGGYAEYCTAPEGQCLPVPSGLSMVEAASLPETFFTVWSNVFDRGKLAKGETLLVHGGTSGIGVTAIQLAIAFGATVWATAGSDQKCDLCKELGASFAINYKEHDFKEAIRKSMGKSGPDVILDMVGGDYTQKNIDILNEEGRLVMINQMEGDSVNIKLGAILKKRLTITGSTLRSRSVAFKSSVAAALENNVWPVIAEGRVRPIVGRTFPLEDASEAHRWMESGAHMGKIILTLEE